MKRKFLKSVSLSMVCCLLFSTMASASLTGFFDEENTVPVTGKTLRYFDNEADWVASDDISGAKIPDGLVRFAKGGDTVPDTDTVVNGLFGKAPDDISFKLAGTGAGNLMASLVRVNYANGANKPTGGNPEYANFTSGTVTVYVDMATSVQESDHVYKGIRSTFYANSDDAQYASLLNFNSDGNIEILNSGEGDTATYTVPYETNKWYSFAVELKGNSLFYNAWIDGTKVTMAESAGNRMHRNQVCTAFSDLCIGREVTADQYDDLYIDNLAIYFDEPYSQERYHAIKDASSISLERDILSENRSIDNVRTDLYLPTEGEYGSTISWTSSNPEVIAEDGTVIQADEETVVTLTATITNGGKSEEKSFTVTVAKFLGANMEDVFSDYEDLTFDAIKGLNMYAGAVVSDLELPGTGECGSTITWVSSNPSVIGNDGLVTRESKTSKRVTLTATITKGEGDEKATDIKEFDLNVLGDDAVFDAFEKTGVDPTTNKAVCDWSKIAWYTDRLGYSYSATSGELGVRGLYCTVGKITGEYIVYDAMPGADFVVDVTRYGGFNAYTFETAGEDKKFTKFTKFSTKTGILIPGITDANNWTITRYSSTEPLPEGTRYLKINVGAATNTSPGQLGRALLSKVQITGYGGHYGNDICMSDILGENTAADNITDDLCIYPMWGVEWESSNTDVIATNGAVTRPVEDTVVTMTAETNTPDMKSKKTFTLTVKAAE